MSDTRTHKTTHMYLPPDIAAASLMSPNAARDDGYDDSLMFSSVTGRKGRYHGDEDPDAESSYTHTHDHTHTRTGVLDKPFVEAPPNEMLKLVGTIIKSFIGSGVLFLPKAFQQGGGAFSPVIMCVTAFITWFTIMRLVRCREKVPGSYGEVGRRAVGRWGQIAVDVSLVLSQAGFCCVYVAFIARNVLQLLNVNSCWVSSNWLWLLVLLQLPIFTPLVWVRRIAYFGITNLLADGLIAGGLIGILAWSIHGMASDGNPIRVELFNKTDFSLFLGTAIYAFEGIGMVVPMYDSLSSRGQARFGRVLSGTLAGIAAAYIIVGIVPYLYLDGSLHQPMQDSVTLNLPREWWAYLIIAAYCLALTFSYPLMLFPAVRIAEGAVTPWLLRPGGETRWRRNIFRCGLVAITLVVSYVAINQLSNLVALVGCFACTPLAFIYPCLFHFMLVDAGPLSKAADITIMLFGAGVLVFSTYEAISTWTESTIDACVLTPS